MTPEQSPITQNDDTNHQPTANQDMPTPRYPSTSQSTAETRQPTGAYIQKLQRACHWLNIDQGRIRDYLRLLEEFPHIPRHTNQHILAYYESCEIVDLLELWENRIHEFPGLKEKIQVACKKGPVLADDEVASSSSNRPRNDTFGYLLAGKFLAAGISVVSIDGIHSKSPHARPTTDFSFRWSGDEINVECKRVQSRTQLPRRAKEARKQITRSGRCGIIAIDYSAIARPAGHLLETSSPRRAEEAMSQWLEHSVAPQLYKDLSPTILGFVLFARLPAMTAIEILNENEEDYRRRDTISSTLVIGNSGFPDLSILKDITQMLKTPTPFVLLKA